MAKAQAEAGRDPAEDADASNRRSGGSRSGLSVEAPVVSPRRHCLVRHWLAGRPARSWQAVEDIATTRRGLPRSDRRRGRFAVWVTSTMPIT